MLRIIDNLCHKLLLQNGNWQQRTHDALPSRYTSGREVQITTAAHVSRIAAWAANHPGMWTGTMAELAAATGISVKEISDAVENRTHELRRDGIAAAVTRSPGKPRMITLSQLEREQAPESHEVTPELNEEDANPQQAQEGQELETEPGPNREPANEIPPEFDKGRWRSELSKSPDWIGIENGSRPRLDNGGGRGLLYLFLYLFLYLKSANSAHPALSVSQPVSAPEPAARSGRSDGIAEARGGRGYRFSNGARRPGTARARASCRMTRLRWPYTNRQPAKVILSHSTSSGSLFLREAMGWRPTVSPRMHGS